MSKIIKELSEYVIDEYPETCKVCPFVRMYAYQDNAYCGVYYLCMLGYMDEGDTREFDVRRKRWTGCDIENNPSVFVEGEE